MQVTITPSRSKHQKVIITILICFETWASCTVHDTVPATFPLAKLGRWNWPNQEPTIPKLMELATDRSSTKTPQHFFSHAPCDQSIGVSYNEWLSRHVSIQSVKKSFQPQSEWTIITQPVQQATSPSACPSVCTSVSRSINSKRDSCIDLTWTCKNLYKRAWRVMQNPISSIYETQIEEAIMLANLHLQL